MLLDVEFMLIILNSVLLDVLSLLLSFDAVLMTSGFALSSLDSVLLLCDSVLLCLRQNIAIFVFPIYFRFCPLVLTNKRTNLFCACNISISVCRNSPGTARIVGSIRTSGGFFSLNPSSSRRRCPKKICFCAQDRTKLETYPQRLRHS